MGLDMFAYKFKGKTKKHVDIKVPDDAEEVAYWRKHPNLHGWMEQLYRENNGKDATFNCSTVRITEDVLDALEEDVKAGNLPDTSGFFFGESTNEDKKTDLKFIKDARKALKDGYIVVYSSWW